MKKLLLLFGCITIMLGLSVSAFDEIGGEVLLQPLGGYNPVVTCFELDEISVNDSDTEEKPVFSLYSSTQPDSSTEVEESEYYGYNVLIEEDRNNGTNYAGAYNAIKEGLAARKNSISLLEYNLTKDSLNKVFHACTGDYPQFFHIKHTGYSVSILDSIVVSVSPQYLDEEQISGGAQALETVAAAVLKSSGVREGMSDYDKAIMIHNELVNHISYDYENLSLVDSTYADRHSAYGALVNGRAVCDGYARAYQYLLYKVGIVSHLATGKGTSNGNTERHAWNLVKLDGEWYYTDLTWNDSEQKDCVFYSYFNLTSAEMGKDHTLDNAYEMPNATATKNNYFVKNGGTDFFVNDVDKVTKQLESCHYARILLDGRPVSELAKWYYTVDEEGYINGGACLDIMQKLGLRSLIGMGYRAKGNEIILIMKHDSVSVMRNPVLQICSAQQRSCKIMAAFYDENGRMLKLSAAPDQNLKKGDIVTLPFTDAPPEYKSIRYFVWSQDNGLKPLFEKNEQVY